MDTTGLICRLCAEPKEEDKLVNFKNNLLLGQLLFTKLTRINAVVDYNASNLPYTICYSCIDDLESAFSFVLRVERAQAKLSGKLYESDIKNDVEEDYLASYRHPKSEGKESVQIKIEMTQQNTDTDEDETVSSIPSDTTTSSNAQLTWKDFTWVCAFCKIEFSTIVELNAHSMEQHKCCNAYWCTTCDIRRISLNKFLLHIYNHKPHLIHSCHKCFVEHKSGQDMREHLKVHITSTHVCDGCNDNFTDSEELKQHKKQYYKIKRSKQRPPKSNTKNVLCSICPKSFFTKNGLKHHLLSNHTERTRNYTCETCGKGFFNESDVRSHASIHTGIKPFKCKICNSSFRNMSQLRCHVRIHGAKKTFSCEQCGKSFRLEKQLKAHSIIHSDQQPYVCAYCNKSFRRKNGWKLHLSQHTGVKPYSCETCTREFTNWGNYNKHMKRIHNKDISKRKIFYSGEDSTNPTDIEQWKSEIMTAKQRDLTNENNL